MSGESIGDRWDVDSEVAGLGWVEDESEQAFEAAWDEEKHPRAPAGGEGGGRFVSIEAEGAAKQVEHTGKKGKKADFPTFTGIAGPFPEPARWPPIENARKEAVAWESRHRDDPSESAFAAKLNGDTILDKSGGKTSVEFTPEEAASLKNAVMTHNHPPGWGFSDSDVAFAVVADMAEMRCVGRDMFGDPVTYTITRPEGGWSGIPDPSSMAGAQPLSGYALAWEIKERARDWYRFTASQMEDRATRELPTVLAEREKRKSPPLREEYEVPLLRSKESFFLQQHLFFDEMWKSLGQKYNLNYKRTVK